MNRTGRPAILLFAGLLAAPLLPTQAAAQAWAVVNNEAKLTVPVALFVQEPATGYGMYVARKSNRFNSADPLFFYMEPKDFGYASEGELTKFGAVLDLKIIEAGRTVFSKDGFLEASFTSHHQNKEVNFSGRLTVNGAPKGDYKLEVTVRDAITGKTALVELPFSIE